MCPAGRPHCHENWCYSNSSDLSTWGQGSSCGAEVGASCSDDYIVGSAEVVGLMCLHVFVFGDRETYQRLLPNARSLGAAFQKVNFLRDLKDDFEDKGRVYFPGVDMRAFNADAKAHIEREIATDFRHAYEGIIKLPKESRLGVYVAYVYYQRLFQKIAALPSNRILQERVRIPNRRKATLFVGSYLRHSFNLL